MPKFSCADFTFPMPDRSVALRLIKLLGFDYVDIGLLARSSHFSPLELQKSPQTYTTEVLRDLHAAELSVSDVFVQIGVDPSECATNDPSPEVRSKSRDVFKRALDFCVDLGCSHLTGLPGVFHPTAARDQDLELAAEETSRRVAECASAGVRYAIEAHIGSICAEVESARAFLDSVEGLTLTLDYGHFIMAGETSAKVHDLLPFASHVHVRGGALGRLQTPVEENAIDFPGMLAGLTRLGYDGFLALEYVWVNWMDCNRTDNVSETLLLRRALESNDSMMTKAIDSD
jgi:sugar phosphate isomerase/epimerase